MTNNNIKTLQQLADYINAHDEWQMATSDIIERNGWHYETGETYGVCSHGNEKVVKNENGQAEVIAILV